MRRREFIILLGSAAATGAAMARAEQPDRVRRIGVLYAVAETDQENQAWGDAFRKRLTDLRWIVGRNISIDYRWGAGSVELMQQFAKQLVELSPEVIFAVTTPATAALQAETHMIPIVFASVSDPIGSKFVVSLAKPGGNITGFSNFEASLTGKWLELLREIAPQISRVGLLFNPRTAPYARYYLDTFRFAASAQSVEPIEAPVQSPAEVEVIMTKLGREAGAGVIVMPDTGTVVFRETIISLADRHRLPTIYPLRVFVNDGGLIYYGIDFPETFRGAASYVDRILRGAKPDQLPVQQPSKFELIINLKAAKALGLDVPLHLQQLADELIE
jgi:putative tryptophan/tyrosine transport system substrate-binding protein